MRLQKYKSTGSGILSDYIESFDYYQWDNEYQKSPILMFPEGVVEIIFAFSGKVYHCTSYQPTWKARIPVFIGGLHDRAYQLSAKEKGEIFSIRFRPGAFSFFSDIPVHKIKNRLITLENIFPRDGKDLEEKILAAKNNHIRRKWAEKFFQKKKIEKNISQISLSIHHIHQSQGVLSIEKLAKQVYMSDSHFRKVFRETVGLSPKQYASVIRINSLMKDWKMCSKPLSISELCYKYDYCDPSHLFKDIKKFTGMSPRTIMDNIHIK